MADPQKESLANNPSVAEKPHWLVLTLGIIALVLVVILFCTVLFLGMRGGSRLKMAAPTPVQPTPTFSPTPFPTTNSVLKQSVTIEQK